jgi:hypothetical protein
MAIIYRALRFAGNRHWLEYGWSYGVLRLTGGELIQEIPGEVKANNSTVFICETYTGVLSEIWDYCRDGAGEIVKV